MSGKNDARKSIAMVVYKLKKMKREMRGEKKEGSTY